MMAETRASLEGLDRIPWAKLTHAYGSAEDVPEQLRALRPASPDIDEPPLYQLFGNIYHQGTVSEATSYAVPFLIELAADPETPDRIGILELLASIADGSSYHAVHDPFFRAHGLKLGRKSVVERKKRQELEWVAKAHDAVLAGFDTYMEMTKEAGDVRYAAANVLSRLRSRVEEVGQRLRRMLQEEHRSLYRAGLMLLLGEVGDRSEETLAILESAAGQDDQTVKWAAAFSLARLDLPELSESAQKAVVDAILDEDLYLQLEKLPWDVGDHLDRRFLFQCLGVDDRKDLTDRLLRRVENCDLGEETVYDLLNLVFSHEKDSKHSVRFEDLNPLQLRTVRALVTAMDGGERIDVINLTLWGLPDSKRELRNLGAGLPRTKIDMNLPLLGEAENPRTVAIPGKLKPGDRIHHRYFGLGTVTETEPRGRDTSLTVDFDVEGIKYLGLPSDGSSLEDPPNPFTFWIDQLGNWFRRKRD
jgi:hypothetical protein